MKCFDCPRNCGVDRRHEKGFCREGDKIRVAKVIEHFEWEEPCLTGDKGALAIFFSGCNLRCKFCQNYEISHFGKGQEYTPAQFAKFLASFDLKKFSCIDLISPTQFSSQLTAALSNFSSPVPIVWNSNGYEKVETIEKVAKFVDVFLVDLKYFDPNLSRDLSSCDNYFDFASKAIIKMSLCKPCISNQGLLSQGTIVRHLILPGHTKDSLRLLDFLKQNASVKVSLMSQFTPIPQSPIKRKITPLEQKIVLCYAQKLGLDGYFQDLDSASTCFVPKF